MKQSEKLEKWTAKNYINSSLIYLLNIFIIFGIFLFVVFLGNISGKTNIDFKEFITELNKPFYFFLLLVFLLTITYLFYYFFDRDFMRSEKNSELMFLIMEASLIICYLFGAFVSMFLRPIAMLALLITFLIDKKNAVFFSIIFCLITFLIDIFSGLVVSTDEYIYLVISFASSIVAILCVENAFSRIRILIKGLLISIFPIFGVLIGLLISEDIVAVNLLTEFVCALASGPLAVASFIIVLPFFETMFGKITRFKLSELTDHRSKLIQRLINEAPGTFNHSILVSNIAEACATAIGEDALLARACAYYHDIGKLRRPEYFGENSVDGDNPHEKLTPELSTNIIRAHTTDGYNLLIKHNFPKEIANVCKEHHGTMPIYFFYAKAKKFTDGEVNIAQYCYSESKPQSRIAAIIMIADCSEAVSRTLTDRSRENVRKTVEKLVRERMDMGQFDESDITLKELRIIINTVVNNITGIYHNRIEYPRVYINEEQKEEIKENNEKLTNKENADE